MDKKHLYGLLHGLENRFYIVSRDYHVIKMLQMILFRQKFFFCVNITLLETPINESLITNDNCHTLGGSNPLIRHAIPDPDSKMPGVKLINVSGEPNKILKGNLELLYKLIEETETFFQQIEKNERNRFSDVINGLHEFESFILSLLPNDPNIKNFVSTEINNKEKAITRFNNLKSDLLEIFIETDYHEKPVKTHLQEKIDSLTSSDHDILYTLKKVYQGRVWRTY